MNHTSSRHLSDYARVHTNDSDVVILSLYGIFASYHCLNRGRTYRPPHRALPAHIASGLVEVALYYGGWQCSLAAVAACWTHSFTSLMLVRELPQRTCLAYTNSEPLCLASTEECTSEATDSSTDQYTGYNRDTPLTR
ncbi:uncharacterized protein N7473_013112 [Penicillium subrubescens]|uniref:uncharacterized protein n=1 Tax=Penicillium subrubescens TaxID=1316194 RepID=UPI002544E64C|nr:uncharacterized protein N7473_013112 [Penicillium subrubescens]KAJ5874999.1 hypothetical protein N7473_013112 [Penicillium subrubescens]